MQLFFANFLRNPKNQGEIEVKGRFFPTKSMEKLFRPQDAVLRTLKSAFRIPVKMRRYERLPRDCYDRHS